VARPAAEYEKASGTQRLVIAAVMTNIAADSERNSVLSVAANGRARRRFVP
jgi:hypothetical protein